MQEVSNLCDDVVIIGHGKVMFDGTLQGLRDEASEADLEDAFVKVIGE
jgi:sodium transport system ATP-binding protein